MFAFKNPIMFLQEPSVLYNKTVLSVAFGLRNHIMVLQEPSFFEHSSSNLNTSEILLSQEPYHGSSGTIHFETQFHKFEHFCMPRCARFIRAPLPPQPSQAPMAPSAPGPWALLAPKERLVPQLFIPWITCEKICSNPIWKSHFGSALGLGRALYSGLPNLGRSESQFWQAP